MNLLARRIVSSASPPRIFSRTPLIAVVLTTTVLSTSPVSSFWIHTRTINHKMSDQHHRMINTARFIKGPVSASWKGDDDGDSPLSTEALDKCVLPLSKSSHKGSSGRVGVLGGSAQYTGAPYYASMAALKMGSDLAFIFCAEEASLPLKCYSPELMVSPVYQAKEFDAALEGDDNQGQQDRLVNKMVDKVVSGMDRLHVLVIGPGLGRCPLVLKATAKIIKTAINRQLPLILDADGLFLLTLKENENLLQGYDRVILTPNVVERKRLASLIDDNDDFPLQKAVIVEKGPIDIISLGGTDQFYECTEEGGLKRSGGLGDILSGTIGTMAAWNAIQDHSTTQDLPLACWTACCFIKRATRLAYDEQKRSMTAPDVLSALGSAVNDMTGDNGQSRL